jgi:hypothetical protein
VIRIEDLINPPPDRRPPPPINFRSTTKRRRLASESRALWSLFEDRLRRAVIAFERLFTLLEDDCRNKANFSFCPTEFDCPQFTEHIFKLARDKWLFGFPPGLPDWPGGN